MKVVADLWPLLVVAALGFCMYALIRLTSRFSPGAKSAGPKTPPDSLFSDKTETAETLRTIEERLDTRPGAMIDRIERSCRDLGVPVDRIEPGVSPEQRIDVLLRRLETHLGLGSGAVATASDPLVPTNEPHPTNEKVRP